MAARDVYIVEAREPDGKLSLAADALPRWQQHPYLRHKRTFTIDDLTWWISFGEGRNTPTSPDKALAFLSSIGLPARLKTW